MNRYQVGGDRYGQPQYVQDDPNRQVGMIQQDSVQNDDIQLAKGSSGSLRKYSCCLGLWSILLLILCVAFGVYFAIYLDEDKICDKHNRQWLWWCVSTPGLALLFFLYISIFKCTRICCCKCWECCCNNDQNSKGATKCKICYEQ